MIQYYLCLDNIVYVVWMYDGNSACRIHRCSSILLAEAWVQTKFLQLILTTHFHKAFPLWNHMSYPKKSPLGTPLLCFVQKTVWVTKGGTRKGQFREIVAKAKRCIFLHIVNEKLILGPYKEVHISVFFKTIAWLVFRKKR